MKLLEGAPHKGWLLALPTNIGLGVDFINLFDVNLLTLSCMLDIYIKMQLILLLFVNWSNLQKGMSKSMPK